MLHMSPYAFEKMLQEQATFRRHQDASRLKETAVRQAWSPAKWIAFFRHSKKSTVKGHAYRVLEELLSHERAEIRLRAAEIIIGTRRNGRAH
ncbi:MAG: hypothetical protein P0Y55_02765 [Candidatus Cohnella colombiensis]|uniref:Uncharacterized protein n=1 Tax=Candidatus Cohnella colombiensis TaxID=3121368 RepID=A0AA95EY15_9BACL|nr:MAG: hypothetical protein P0Y55_02765 [Cohnella sp.]